MALSNALDQMIERSDPPRGDDGHGHGIGDGPRQGKVETGPGAVAVGYQPAGYSFAATSWAPPPSYGAEVIFTY